MRVGYRTLVVELDQAGEKQVQAPHHLGIAHGGIAADLGDPQQAGAQLGIPGVQHRPLRGKAGHGDQPAGVGAVEPHPAVFPGVEGVGAVADQLAGGDEEQIAGLQ